MAMQAGSRYCNRRRTVSGLQLQRHSADACTPSGFGADRDPSRAIKCMNPRGDVAIAHEIADGKVDSNG